MALQSEVFLVLALRRGHTGCGKHPINLISTPVSGANPYTPLTDILVNANG